MNKISNNSNSNINQLKKLTLSIDKGITGDVNQQIIKLTDRLFIQWQHDKVLSTLVKMVRALSDYAVSRKNDAHKDTPSLIQSIVNQISNLSSAPGIDLPVAKKQAILSAEIEKYNILKQQIKSASRVAGSVEDHKSEVESNIIADLKGIILSLDWEITDEIIHRLDRETQKLQTHWKNSKIHLSFLQMFKSIGSYVLSKGSNTHPDSISLLHSLYRNFEQIVLSPAMTVETQREILLREMKKFNDLKKIISSANRPKETQALTPKGRPAISPMDDLIGTKVSNLSPVDDLIEEIHMLQGSEDIPHSADASTASHSHPKNSAIKEVTPNRRKSEPIPEIQARLDAFFDEDESLSELSFADSGEEVVPYRSETRSSAPSYSSDQELAFEDDYKSEETGELAFEESLSSAPDQGRISFEEASAADLFEDDSPAEEQQDEIIFEDDSPAEGQQDEITFEDDSPAQGQQDEIIFEDGSPAQEQQDEITFEDGSPEQEQSAVESSSLMTADDMVPYNFEDEFFDDDIEPLPSKDSQKREPANIQRAVEEQMEAPDIEIAEEDLSIAEEDAQLDVAIQKIEDSDITAEMVLIEELKTTIAKSIFLHGAAKELQTLDANITALEELWKRELPETLILLKVVRSLTGYLGLLSSANQNETLEFMLHVVESMKNRGVESSENGSNYQKSALIDIFSKYIDFQNTVVDRQTSKATSEREVILEPGQMGLPENHIKSENSNPETEIYSDLFNQPETLADKEIFYDRPSEDTSEIEKQLTEQRGLWSKIRRFLGF